MSGHLKMPYDWGGGRITSSDLTSKLFVTGDPPPSYGTFTFGDSRFSNAQDWLGGTSIPKNVDVT